MLCDIIHIVNIQQTIKKLIDCYPYNFHQLIKIRQKPDSFVVHYNQPFKDSTPHTDLKLFMIFLFVRRINPIRLMKKFTKLNCNLFLEECYTIHK